MWEEDGKYPNLIIELAQRSRASLLARNVELLSTSTATTDRTRKKDLYQERFRTPEYFWFSPDTLEFEGWRLMGRYQEITPNPQGWRWSEELGLYLGVEQEQLRSLRLQLTAQGKKTYIKNAFAHQSISGFLQILWSLKDGG